MIKTLLENSQDVLEKCVSTTFEYLKENKSAWTKKSPVSKQTIEDDISKFLNTSPVISKQTTVPDELVSDVLEFLCGFNANLRQEIQRQYNQQKQVEQKIIGAFLEAYILKHSFKYGWVQCGNCISGTDMIKKNSDGSWFKLQIKNSDNTQNSSSAGFISNKAITWARRNSKKGTQYWEDFPDINVRKHLSENKFKEFIVNYYKNKI